MALDCSEKSCLLPVTALEFCNFHGSQILISGEFALQEREREREREREIEREREVMRE